MAGFSVLVVGGSVAGLAFANILEQYGIEYTVIEKHDTIAPQLGASITLLPHGSSILEQLGCYYGMKELAAANCMGIYGPDGNALNISPNAGESFKELCLLPLSV